MTKGKKEELETETPIEGEEDFIEEEESVPEEFDIEDDKSKNIGKHTFESRRKLEDILEDKKRRKQDDYFFDLDDDSDKP